MSRSGSAGAASPSRWLHSTHSLQRSDELVLPPRLHPPARVGVQVLHASDSLNPWSRGRHRDIRGWSCRPPAGTLRARTWQTRDFLSAEDAPTRRSRTSRTAPAPSARQRRTRRASSAARIWCRKTGLDDPSGAACPVTASDACGPPSLGAGGPVLPFEWTTSRLRAVRSSADPLIPRLWTDRQRDGTVDSS